MGEIVLIRHGETEWSANGRHTSVTDLELNATGRRQAKDLANALRGRQFVEVWSSPRRRSLATAQLAGLNTTRVDADLVEWNYGKYEGITTVAIRKEVPDWNIWRDGCPGGESVRSIGTRQERILERIRPLLRNGDVALVGHAHAFRVAAACWVGLPPSAGALLKLDTASISTLGYEREQSVIRHWNIDSHQKR